jgi:hypothetical protein
MRLSRLAPVSSDAGNPWQSLLLASERGLRRLQGRRLYPGSRAARARRRIYGRESRLFFAHPSRAELMAAVGSSISTGAAWFDYFFLYRYVLARRPRRILELGSGVTSAIMAHALREVARMHPEAEPGHLHTLESLPEYFEDAKRICPAELRPHVTHHLSPQQLVAWRGRTWINCYEVLPEGPFDLVFVDGPDHPDMRGRGVVNGDALRALEAHPTASPDLVIDGRIHVMHAYARFLPPGALVQDRALDLSFVARASAGMLRQAPSFYRWIRDADIFAALGV